MMSTDASTPEGVYHVRDIELPRTGGDSAPLCVRGQVIGDHRFVSERMTERIRIIALNGDPHGRYAVADEAACRDAWTGQVHHSASAWYARDEAELREGLFDRRLAGLPTHAHIMAFGQAARAHAPLREFMTTFWRRRGAVPGRITAAGGQTLSPLRSA